MYNPYSMEMVILGLGSNVGDSLGYLKKAVCEISELLQNCKVSDVYKTKPQDYLNQDDFLNLVLAGKCSESPEKLLDQLQEIEAKNNRDRSHEIKKGPRTLDIDILFFGKKIIKTERLEVPHPSIKKRKFVLVPLLQLFPDFVDPITNKAYKYFLQDLKDQGVKHYGSLF